MKIQKDFYGIIQEELLFYKKLTSDFINYGFTPNPYDPCVDNKTVSGKHLTVVWNVDDMKISHDNQSVVTEFIDLLKSKFDRQLDTGKMPVCRGKK